MISISLKGKYGVSALFELALRYEGLPVQIRQISKLQSIPQNYLEQLLVDLKRSGLVKSFRGSQGGYVLAKSPETIKVYDILSCLEGAGQLTDKDSDVLNFFWTKIESEIVSIFSMTLQDLVKEKERLLNLLNYHI